MAEVSEETVTTMSKIRVLCVDDHPLLLEGVVRKVEHQPDMVVVDTPPAGRKR